MILRRREYMVESGVSEKDAVDFEAIRIAVEIYRKINPGKMWWKFQEFHARVGLPYKKMVMLVKKYPVEVANLFGGSRLRFYAGEYSQSQHGRGDRRGRRGYYGPASFAVED